MITKTVEIELDESEILNDIDPEYIIDYLSCNAIGVDNISALADIINNSLLKEEEIKEFLKNLDYEVFKVMKKLLKK